MADDPAAEPAPGNGNGTDVSVAEARIGISAQYIKDLSFENPRAPMSVMQTESAPHGEVSIQVRNRPLGEDNHEIILDFTVEAKHEGEVAFIVELSYGGVFTVTGFDDDLKDIALMVECPRILFPFARRIIADAVQDGGFSPLLLSPVDFLKLYEHREELAAADA